MERSVNSQVAEDLFGALPASTAKVAPVVSEYKGGDFREYQASKDASNEVCMLPPTLAQSLTQAAHPAPLSVRLLQ
jgi:hypothetical protein